MIGKNGGSADVRLHAASLSRRHALITVGAKPGDCTVEVDFVDFDLIDRIVGVSPCHPQARTGVAVLTQTSSSSSSLLLLQTLEGP